MHQTLRSKGVQDGLTFIELMVTIAVVGIVASIAIPSYQDLVERNRLKEVIQLVKSEAQLIRGEAIKRSESVTLSFTAGNAGAWCFGAITSTSSCNCLETLSSETNFCDVTRTLGANHIQTNMSSTTNITFEPRRGTTTPTEINLSTTKHSAKVEISAVGRATACGGTLYEAC